MPKATIQTKSGATIIIEGSESEIATLVHLIDDSRKSPNKNTNKSTPKKNKRVGISDLFNELINEDFFKGPRSLNEVKEALEIKGHFYSLNHLSTPILRKVRSKELRRIKKDGNWFYVN